LEDKNFDDIGIALKIVDQRLHVYALLASPNKVSPVKPKPVTYQKPTWGGPDLWMAVNIRRVERGVNPLKQKDELCTVAAIRLNQILDKGSLDAHEGFEPTLKRDDLAWISKEYNVSEFLISGYATPTESVDAWENTLGHKKLLVGGEYVWGCVYAQNLFGVAIAAY
jgi:hypothetical protein